MKVPEHYLDNVLNIVAHEQIGPPAEVERLKDFDPSLDYLQHDQSNEVAVEIQQSNFASEASENFWPVEEPQDIVDHEGPVDEFDRKVDLIEDACSVFPTKVDKLLDGFAPEKLELLRAGQSESFVA